MAKVEVEANKLETPQVEWLSLVERGANRAPFKLMKAAKGTNMINLNTLFTRKAEKQAPQVAAIAISKSVPADKAAELVKAAGYSVEKMQKAEDGTLVFAQVEDLEGAVPVQVNEAVVLVMKYFEPYSQDLGFSEAVKAQGFVPSVDMASRVMADKLSATLWSSEDKEGAVTAIEKCVTDFSAWVTTQARQIPSTAFKMAGEIAKAVTKVDSTKGECTGCAEKDAVIKNYGAAPGNGKCPAGEEMKDGKCVAMKKKTDAEVAAEVAATKAAEDAAAEKATTDAVAKGEKTYKPFNGKCSDNYDLVDGMCVKKSEVVKEPAVQAPAFDPKAFAATIAASVAGEVGKVMEAVTAQGVSLMARIGEVEKVAKAAEASVKGKVVGADPAADAETRVGKTASGDGAAQVEIHDTAFQPGIRKQTLGYRNPQLGLVKASPRR